MANFKGNKSAERKLKLEPHQVILRPLVTEKGVYQSESMNHYAFEVNPLATKTEIKAAVELLFNVQVDKVATQIRKGKTRRFKMRVGKTRASKKAVVRLKGDARIEFV